MGLLDFAKNIGKKLFDREDDAAEKIQKHIQAENPGVDGLSVTVEDGVAKLSGRAKDAEALEKAVLMAGNVKGIEKVVVDDLEAPPQTAKVEYYEIKKGDTLSKLAKDYYGDPMKYPRIFEANREVIKDADLIYPGQKIRILLD